MYNIVIPHLCTLWCDHHTKFSYHLSVWFLLYEIYKIGKYINTESRLSVARDWGEVGRIWLLNGYEISVWDDENVLGLDRGGGCTTLWLHKMLHTF